MPETHYYEVAAGHRLPHDPFKAIVAPRPIGWISTVSVNGRVNLAPYSFFNGVCDRPPMVMFSSSGRKDTLRNVQETGEFVCNLATRRLAEAMNETCRPLPHGESEMALAKLASAPCRLVKPPRVAASPAAMECKLVRVLQLPTIEGSMTESFVVIGQVVAMHIDTACLRDGLFDMALACTIARCGYAADYQETTELFQMARPRP